VLSRIFGLRQEVQKGGENCMIKSFIMCTPYHAEGEWVDGTWER
jgi:hypothetical protein